MDGRVASFIFGSQSPRERLARERPVRTVGIVSYGATQQCISRESTARYCRAMRRGAWCVQAEARAQARARQPCPRDPPALPCGARHGRGGAPRDGTDDAPQGTPPARQHTSHLHVVLCLI